MGGDDDGGDDDGSVDGADDDKEDDHAHDDDGADDDGSADGADDDAEDDTGDDDGADDDGSVDGADDDKEDDTDAMPAVAQVAQGIAGMVNNIIDANYGTPPPTPAPTVDEDNTADDIVNKLTDTAMDLADSISSALTP